MEENKITVVQALDERDLLVKKIAGKMQKAQFVDLIRPRSAVTWEKRLSRAAFLIEAQSALQQIQDLIARYDLLSAAITQSNAITYLETAQGRMTVAGAIALRNRLRGSGPYGELTDFEGRLVRQMENGYREMVEQQRKKNESLRREKPVRKKGDSGTKIVLLQGSGVAAKGKEDGRADGEGENRQEKNLELLRLFDPLHVRKMAEEIAERREALLAELETKIKISNANTFVTIGNAKGHPLPPAQDEG